jgi:hypothetical protein
MRGPTSMTLLVVLVLVLVPHYHFPELLVLVLRSIIFRYSVVI